MSRSSRTFLVGIVGGAVIGAGMAILFAPDKGSNTRGMLSYRLSKYRDDLKRLINELKKEKNNLVSEAKQQGDEVVLSAKQRADDLIREAEDLLDNIEKSK